ncbi:hypothetical protein DB346_00290 [Verrucomicrobia bacterium LW23]|nr:hypothetical protein DB346_00290 [Verrucomicrobia bacterium LW23]
MKYLLRFIISLAAMFLLLALMGEKPLQSFSWITLLLATFVFASTASLPIAYARFTGRRPVPYFILVPVIVGIVVYRVGIALSHKDIALGEYTLCFFVGLMGNSCAFRWVNGVWPGETLHEVEASKP